MTNRTTKKITSDTSSRNRSLPIALLLFCLFAVSFWVKPLPAQNIEPEIEEIETKAEKTHSIKKATIYSAVLPGLGQAYNRKYWKIPIVYAGFGVLTYFIVTNTQEFKKFEEAYVYVANGETYPIDNDYVDKYNLDQLQTGMDDYRRFRDLSYIITGVWYVLNILDAHVDAHFYDFEISEDLSLKWQPYFKPAGSYHLTHRPSESGIKLTLNF